MRHLVGHDRTHHCGVAPYGLDEACVGLERGLQLVVLEADPGRRVDLVALFERDLDRVQVVRVVGHHRLELGHERLKIIEREVVRRCARGAEDKEGREGKGMDRLHEGSGLEGRGILLPNGTERE